MTDYRKKYFRLKKAVQRWVRAEFAFRYGSRAFTSEMQDWYVKAECDLRLTLTKANSLQAAAVKCKSPGARDALKRLNKSLRSLVKCPTGSKKN